MTPDDLTAEVERDEACAALADLRARVEPIRRYLADLDAFYGDESAFIEDHIDYADGSPTSAALRLGDLRALLTDTTTTKGDES